MHLPFPCAANRYDSSDQQEYENALKGTIMVFSGDFDKAMFAFIHANAMAAQDMPAWCKNTGHEFIKAEEIREGLMRIVIRKGSGVF